MARKGRVTPMSKTQQVGGRKISKKNNCSIEKVIDVLDFNPSKFEDFVYDNLLKIEDSKLVIFEKGRLFTRNIAMRFDPLINQKVGNYSNTI